MNQAKSFTFFVFTHIRKLKHSNEFEKIYKENVAVMTMDMHETRSITSLNCMS